MNIFTRLAAPAAVLLAAVAAPAMAERPVTDFTDKEKMEWATISPDGTKLVADMKVDGESKLVIMPLDGQGSLLPIGLGDGELLQIRWVGNDWLAANVGRKGFWDGREVYITRVVAFRADGSDMKVLEPRDGLSDSGGIIRWVAKDGSPEIEVQYRKTIYVGDEGFYPRVARVDISKDKWSTVTSEMEGVWNWYADTTGAVRVGVGSEDGGRRTRLVYREGSSGLFKEVAAVQGDDWLPQPELFLRDNKALTISRHEGFAGVYEMDLTTMKVGAKVFSKDGYDVTGIITDPIDPHGLRGIAWNEERTKVMWFDPRFQAVQGMIEATFPDGRPDIESSSFDANRHIIYVGRGDKAGYYLLDVAAKRMSPIVKMADNLKWGPVRTYRYKARDGLEIETFLTFPRDREEKNLPVIVMPHGGPRARDYESWDVWAQFYADRGYLVIQPNFRGSTGYGAAFEQAGLGEWGLKMQDDVDDALAWAAAEGYADASRACVIGGSYGGYVAMRAAQRNPDLYRCAVSFAGVADLPDMMRRDSQSFFNRDDLRDYWKGQAADLEGVSPLNYPQQFGIPVLLVHGKEDQRVPVEHSRKMFAALTKAGKTVDYLEQPENDHHFSRDEDMQEFLLKSEEFLDRYNPAN